LWINQGTQWFSGEPLETPQTQCSLRQSPLMTRLPCSPESTLVLRLYQETVHDFILMFMPPCGPHLTPLATSFHERSLLVFSTPGGLTGDDFSRLFFTSTNTSQAATCTLSTQHCQSLITQGSNHPPVLEPHMVLKVENKDSYKHKSKTSGKYRSRRDHNYKHKSKHKDKRRTGRRRAEARPERWLERVTSTPVPRTPP
jgi:hypothetical protein